MPRLSADITPVYVEATPEETETRLLHGLRKLCPALEKNLSLKETLATLRRGQGIPVGKKVLIVLDQFEQWLYAHKEESNTDLVQALRQCDGSRVQCIVMVRDDFWLAVSRFLRDLEVRLVEGENSALADLFDLDHARKVLSAFGRAFGKLPEASADTNQDQEKFLSKAIAGLTEEGKVICVRLSLFAEMMKGKTWTPATLKEVGGTQGVGVTFLEETFSASTAPPEHRYHQKAARAVLRALLPDKGTDIKGHMRSHAELLDASGYASRPKDFADLIRILDSELRLITPTDPEGVDDDNDSKVQLQAGRKVLPTHARLPGSFTARLVDSQAERDPSRTRGTQAGRQFRQLECQAGKPFPAVVVGASHHPAADGQDKVDRASAEDDESGGTCAWHSLGTRRYSADRGRCWWPRYPQPDRTESTGADCAEAAGARSDSHRRVWLVNW